MNYMRPAARKEPLFPVWSLPGGPGVKLGKGIVPPGRGNQRLWVCDVLLLDPEGKGVKAIAYDDGIWTFLEVIVMRIAGMIRRPRAAQRRWLRHERKSNPQDSRDAAPPGATAGAEGPAAVAAKASSPCTGRPS